MLMCLQKWDDKKEARQVALWNSNQPADQVPAPAEVGRQGMCQRLSAQHELIGPQWEEHDGKKDVSI